MARKDQADSETPRDPDSGPEEEADGYRPSRRRTAQADKEPEAKVDKPEKELGKLEAFMEVHWESWLRPVLLLIGLGVGIFTYKWEILPEGIAGMLCAGGVVAVTIFSTAMPTLDLIPERKWRLLFGALVAVWSLSAGFPALRKAVPRPVLGEAVLTEQSKSSRVKLQGGSGPFDITVTGKLERSGAQQVNASYELTIAGTGVTETVEGELEYAVHQTRVRRGTTSWSESHDQVVHRLPTGLTGSELTLSVDRVDDLLKDGLHVIIHPQDMALRLLMPKIAGVEVPVLGVLVILLMMLIEARVGDKANKTHLVMASMITLVFVYRFNQRASSNHLVAPAVEALFVALVLGGALGTFIGWIVRRASGRSKLKPPRKGGKKDSEADDD